MAQATIDDVVKDVTDESSVDDSIVALVTSLAAQIAAAGTDPAKLQAIHDGMLANMAKIKGAVTAGTPVTPAQAAAVKP